MKTIEDVIDGLKHALKISEENRLAGYDWEVCGLILKDTINISSKKLERINKESRTGWTNNKPEKSGLNLFRIKNVTVNFAQVDVDRGEVFFRDGEQFVELREIDESVEWLEIPND